MLRWLEKYISHHTKVRNFLIWLSVLPLHQFAALLFWPPKRQSQIFSSYPSHALCHPRVPHCISPRTLACWRIACGGLTNYFRFYHNHRCLDIDWSLLRSNRVARVVPLFFFHEFAFASCLPSTRCQRAFVWPLHIINGRPLSTVIFHRSATPPVHQTRLLIFFAQQST